MLLQNVQADFVEALLSKENQPDLPVEPAANLAIHRNNILSCLTETLQNTYPLIHTLLGSDFFQMTAKEYIRQYPSRSGNLHDYGEYFADFLSEYPPVHHLIYLAEVAEFEWACHHIYLAPDLPSFDLETLKQYTPEQYEQIRFVLNPASYLRKFHFPILKILDLCVNDPEATVDLSSDTTNLLMIRKELDISLASLPQEDFIFLEALSNHHTLLEALHLTQITHPTYQLEDKLPGFVQDKIIVDCYLSDEIEITESTL
jgi:hypothetical protein